jgi:hypothetical protein
MFRANKEVIEKLRKRAIKLYREGNSLRQIEMLLNHKISRETIANIMRKEGIIRKKSYNYSTKYYKSVQLKKSIAIQDCLNRWGFKDIDEMILHFKIHKIYNSDRKSNNNSEMLTQLVKNS